MFRDKDSIGFLCVTISLKISYKRHLLCERSEGVPEHLQGKYDLPLDCTSLGTNPRQEVLVACSVRASKVAKDFRARLDELHQVFSIVHVSPTNDDVVPEIVYTFREDRN